MSPTMLAVVEILVGLIAVSTLSISILLLIDFIRKPRSISGEKYLYSKSSDTNFFYRITEFRNDISGK